MRKLKIIVLVLFAFNIIAWIFITFFYYDTKRRTELIKRQDSLIKRSLKDDRFDKKIEKYTDSIKAITNQITILINNKEVSGTQIVSLINKLQTEKDSLNNKLWETSQLMNFAKKTYRFDVYMKRTGKETTLNVKESPADSARLLLMYFRDRLKKNSDGKWTVDVTGNEEDKRKLRNALKQSDSLLKVQ